MHLANIGTATLHRLSDSNLTVKDPDADVRGRKVLDKAGEEIGSVDDLTIDDSRIVQAPAGNSEITERKMSTPTGFSVMNQDGAIIGSVDDFEFEEENGQLIAMLIHRGGLIGIGGSNESIPASVIRANGPRMITIDTVLPTVGGGSMT